MTDTHIYRVLDINTVLAAFSVILFLALLPSMSLGERVLRPAVLEGVVFVS